MLAPGQVAGQIQLGIALVALAYIAVPAAIELGAELKVIRILIFKNNVGHLGITLHINTQGGTRIDQINSGDAGIGSIG